MAFAHKELEQDTTMDGVAYDFHLKRGQLFLSEARCCAMTRCIQLFERIDPDIELVEIFVGAERDTIYRKGPDRWLAYRTKIKHSRIKRAANSF